MFARVRSQGSQIQRAGARSIRAPGSGDGHAPCATRTGGAAGLRAAGFAGAGADAAGFGLRAAGAAGRFFFGRFGDCAAAAGTATEAATVAPRRLRKARRRLRASAAARAAGSDPPAGATAAPAAPRGAASRFVCSHRATISSAGPVFEGVTTVAARRPCATILWPPSGSPSQPRKGRAPQSRRCSRRAFRAPTAIESFWQATRSGRNASAVFRRSQATMAFSPLASVQSPFRPRTSKPVPSASFSPSSRSRVTVESAGPCTHRTLPPPGRSARHCRPWMRPTSRWSVPSIAIGRPGCSRRSWST